MPNTFQADKTYNLSDVLMLLSADVDSDKENLDKSNRIIIEEEKNSQDNENEFAEDEPVANENLYPPNSASKIKLNSTELFEKMYSRFLMKGQADLTSFKPD